MYSIQESHILWKDCGLPCISYVIFSSGIQELTSLIHWEILGGSSSFHLTVIHLLASVIAKLKKWLIPWEVSCKSYIDHQGSLSWKLDVLPYEGPCVKYFQSPATFVQVQSRPMSCVIENLSLFYSEGSVGTVFFKEVHFFRCKISSMNEFVLTKCLSCVNVNSLGLLIHFRPLIFCDLGPRTPLPFIFYPCGIFGIFY